MAVAIRTDNIKSRIYTIRGMQVMLDEDLAELYTVGTKVLNQAVKRNSERFPEHFMFQLTEEEFKILKSQFVTSSEWSLRSQIVTLDKGRGTHRKYLPFVFTEQGVAMLSGILKSEIAVQVSIQIMDAFVVMRKFISTKAQLFQRIDRTEQKLLDHDTKFDELFNLIEERGLKPDKGIFFDGQIFDAYTFVSDIIRTAQESIILIDNYVDDSVLTLLSKRKEDVRVIIFTKDIPKQLALDVAKYNLQYSPIEVREFKEAHDRFLIIDDAIVYHFGASLKDLGKKWFGFSKFDKEALIMLEKLGVR